jgi:hypothetical protein
MVDNFIDEFLGEQIHGMTENIDEYSTLARADYAGIQPRIQMRGGRDLKGDDASRAKLESSIEFRGEEDAILEGDDTY